MPLVRAVQEASFVFWSHLQADNLLSDVCKKLKNVRDDELPVWNIKYENWILSWVGTPLPVILTVSYCSIVYCSVLPLAKNSFWGAGWVREIPGVETTLPRLNMRLDGYTIELGISVSFNLVYWYIERSLASPIWKYRLTEHYTVFAPLEEDAIIYVTDGVPLVNASIMSWPLLITFKKA